MSVNYSPGEKIELSPKQMLLISALLAGNSIISSSKIANISEKTAHLWLKQPHFKQALEEAKQEAFNEKLGILRDGLSLALRTLMSLMTDKETPSAVRARCAQVWVEQAIEVYRTNELEERLKELEWAAREV